MAGAVDCRSLRRGARMIRPPSARAGRGGGLERRHVDGAHGIICSHDTRIIPKICRAICRGDYGADEWKW